MHKRFPQVSVVVPCYNQAEYLSECLESIAGQIFTDWECIIVNDGSTDNTEKVAHEWSKNDSRFVYINKENGGLSSARNAGIGISNGTFILPLDADDKISSTYLQNAIKIFANQKDTRLVYCKAAFFGERNELWDLPQYNYKDLLYSNMIFCSALFRKEDWRRAGGYDESIRLGWEDWEFWIRLLDGESKVVLIDEV